MIKQFIENNNTDLIRKESNNELNTKYFTKSYKAITYRKPRQ